MKLIKREESHYLFLIGKRERETLFALLQRYPVIPSAHFHTRHPPKSSGAKTTQELLDQSLADQQRENRKVLEQTLAETGRFTETDLGFNFRLTDAEVEWLLQILNDIRIGSWVQLGQPDQKSPSSIPLNEQTMLLMWSMEISALFQHSLLEATQPTE